MRLLKICNVFFYVVYIFLVISWFFISWALYAAAAATLEMKCWHLTYHAYKLVMVCFSTCTFEGVLFPVSSLPSFCSIPLFRVIWQLFTKALKLLLDAISSLCMSFTDDVFEALLSLTTDQSVLVTNGGEGRRRHAAYSKCYTQSAVNKYFTVFNKVWSTCNLLLLFNSCIQEQEKGEG